MRLLVPHLTGENHVSLLAAATGLGTRAVEELVARRFPRPDLATSIRRVAAPPPPVSSLPATTDAPGFPATIEGAAPRVARLEPSAIPSAVSAPFAPSTPSVPSATFVPSAQTRRLAEPLSADRFRIAFTASAGTLAKLRRAQDLLRHAVPNGDPAEIVDRALTLLLADLVRRKAAEVGRPAADQSIAKAAKRTAKGGTGRSRHVPAVVKRAVWSRDAGQCAFHAPSGRRCTARTLLEYHHVEPFAAGGASTAGNIELRCRAHNGYEAVLFYGPSKVFHRASGVASGAEAHLSARGSTGRAAS